MQLFQSTGGRKGRSAFCDIHTYLMYDGPRAGEFLYEQIADGHWAYRCDDLTRLLALSNYRCAIVYADYTEDQPGHDRRASDYFCEALVARPDVVFDLVKKEGLSPKARAAFEAAMQIPTCYIKDGWRTRGADPPGQGRPGYYDPNWQ